MSEEIGLPQPTTTTTDTDERFTVTAACTYTHIRPYVAYKYTLVLRKTERRGRVAVRGWKKHPGLSGLSEWRRLSGVEDELSNELLKQRVLDAATERFEDEIETGQ